MALVPDDAPINGGVTLVLPVFQSPNYIAGVSGWAVFIDGSCEFNNGTFRGTVTASTFKGTNFIINSAGTFFYSATPAAGNLIVSIAPTAGADTFGNTYPQGVGITGTGGALTAKQGNNLLQIIAQAPAVTFNPNTLTMSGGIIQGQDGGTFGTLIIGSPFMLTGAGVQALLTMSSDVAAGTGRQAEFNCLLIVDKQIQVGSTTSTALMATGAATATTTSYSAMVTGEASSRWINDASGKQGWGPGTATRDTFQERIAAKALLVTDFIHQAGAAVAKTTANVALGIAPSGPITIASVTITAVAGRSYLINATYHGVIPGAATSDTFTMAVHSSVTAADLASNRALTVASNVTQCGGTITVVDTPGAGVVTYTLTANHETGAAAATLSATATAPASISVTGFG